jgi:hypothetical protein
MKQHLFLVAIAAIALNACGPVYVVHQDPPPPAPAQPAAEPEEVSYQQFYDQLSPYGQWVDNPQYGYVWLPDAGPDFKPYSTNGHWVYTDEGWTWASDYPWGWAAFHYGRWFFQDGYGWMWIPGQEWAPAWVSWRNSPDYYGWAPLGPSVSISASFGGGYNPPPHYWSFVPHQYVSSPQVRNYYVNESRNVTIINNTTVINNTVINNNNGRNNNRGRNNYAGGPDANEVGRFSGAPLRPIAIRDSRAPGEQNNNGGIAIYRPRINTPPADNRSGRPGVAPARVQPLSNARPVNTTMYNGDRNNGNDNDRNNDRNNGRGNDRNNDRSNDRNNERGNAPSGQPNNQGAVQTGSQGAVQTGNQGAVQPGNQGSNRPIAQPVNPPVNQGYGRPFNQGNVPPPGQGTSQQGSQGTVPAAGQPVNQGNGRPGSVFQQPAQNTRNQQPVPTVQQPNAQQQYNQRPGSQPVPNRQPLNQQPVPSSVQPNGQQSGQPGRPGFNRIGANATPPAQTNARPVTAPVVRPAPRQDSARRRP